MNAPRLIHQQSGRVDYGTPLDIVMAARLTMGGIDLDPASAPYWNKHIQAKQYWHVSNVSNRWYQPQRKHPLKRRWLVDQEPCTVWMNHPYGAKENLEWVTKLYLEFKRGHVKEACCITWAEQSTRWGKLLREFPRWIPDRRVPHLDIDGQPMAGSTKGSMVTYMGPHVVDFIYYFSRLEIGGSVDIPVSAGGLSWLQE